MAEHFPRRLSLIVLIVTLVVVFYRVFLGEVLFWGLPALQFYPWRDFAFDTLRAGQLPLWNPYNGAGAPLIANYQSALFYPFNWFGFFLPLEQSMSITTVVHLFIAGWGMYAFTGKLGLPVFGRGVSALAFGLTSYLVARLGTYPIIHAAVWLPWLMWATDHVLTRGWRRDIARLAFFGGMQLLAGHAQTTWYSMLLVGVYALWWTLTPAPVYLPLPGIEEKKSPFLRERAIRFAFVMAGVALSAGIAAIQLLPTAELLTQSQRSTGVDFDFAMNYSYAPIGVLNMLAPNVLGNPGNGTYVAGGAFFENAVYIGFIPLIAAFAAFFGWIARRKDSQNQPYFRVVPFWWLIVIAAFVLALGKNSPIFPFLYQNVPTFDLFQAPVRWHLWTVFGLSVLAGIGTAGWNKGKWRIFWTRLATAGCAGVIVLALLIAPILLPENIRSEDGVQVLIAAAISTGILGAAAGILTLLKPEPETRWYSWLGLWEVVVLVIIAADLGWAAWGLNPTVPAAFFDERAAERSTRAYWSADDLQTVQYETHLPFDDYPVATDNWQVFRNSHLPNLNLLDREPLFNNFDPLLIGGFASYLDLIDREDAALSASILQGAGISGIFDEQENHIALDDAPLTWLVTSVCWHLTEEALIAAVSDENWQPYRQLHLLGDAGCAAPMVEAMAGIEGISPAVNEVDISVNNSVENSWLVLADSAYPGWIATIDGIETPIYQANIAFRAVQVPRGEHNIRFDYRPSWVLPGMLISIISLLGLLVLFRSTTLWDRK